MSPTITFAGSGSGLPVKDWINALMQVESTRLSNLQKQKSTVQTSKTALNGVESKFSSLRSSVEKLTDANLSSAFDLFGRKLVTSSDTTIATATVSNKAAVQNIDLKVDNLATDTTAKSLTAAGKTIEGADVFTSLLSGDAKEGKFSIYVDGVKKEFTIAKGDTLQNIADDISGAGITGLSATVSGGKFNITYDNTQITNLKLGSSSDTSNFLNTMSLSTATAQSSGGDNMTVASTIEVSKVNVTGKIVGNTANLAGTIDKSSYKFKVGESEFTIGADTTLQGIINSINSDDKAGVIARYDTRSNKLTFTAKDPGAKPINFEDTSGDFLQQMHIITPTGDSLSSQTLGQNAKVYLNGSTDPIEVNSNTLTSDVTGIAGVTITLKNKTDVNTTLNLNVEQDTDQISSALDDFVSKFNAIVSAVDTQTKSGSDLAGEYSLVSLRNTLRTTATSRVSGLSNCDSLAMIGITTGKVGTSVDGNTTTLSLDKTKLLQALQDHPEEVKSLLIGDSSKGITGVFQQLKTKVTSALDPVNGYFEARKNSMNSQSSSLDQAITRESERLDKREKNLTAQFNQMDQYITKMQQQSTALSSL